MSVRAPGGWALVCGLTARGTAPRMIYEPESPEERDNTPGTEGDSSDSAESLPAAPTDDDAEAGDTDQHSSSDA